MENKIKVILTEKRSYTTTSGIMYDKQLEGWITIKEALDGDNPNSVQILNLKLNTKYIVAMYEI